MRSGLRPSMSAFSLLLLSASAFGQAGPPAPSSLADISGCSLDGEFVFIVTGKDATARRYKYPWDASIDALCNANGYAINSPAKAALPQAGVPRPAAAPAPAMPTPAPAGSPGPTEFPADAVALSADAVAKKVSSRTFETQLRDGTRVRLEYKGNGYVFVNAPGYANSGSWRAEESRICSHMRNAAASCNEVRELGQTLYVKRDNGEVIALNPQ
jgi:hypothetical protein